MKSKKYYLYLTTEEYRDIIQSLIEKKNALVRNSRYTDAVDDLLCKFAKARKKKVKIR